MNTTCLTKSSAISCRGLKRPSLGNPEGERETAQSLDTIENKLAFVVIPVEVRDICMDLSGLVCGSLAIVFRRKGSGDIGKYIPSQESIRAVYKYNEWRAGTTWRTIRHGNDDVVW